MSDRREPRQRLAASGAFTNSPISSRLPVNITSGITAKLSCKRQNHLAQDAAAFRFPARR